MKTVEEFIKEIENSEKLQKELKELASIEEVGAFLKKYEVDITVEEFAFVLFSNSIDSNSEIENEGEMSDDAVEKAVGGAGGVDWSQYGPSCLGLIVKGKGHLMDKTLYDSYKRVLDIPRDTDNSCILF